MTQYAVFACSILVQVQHVHNLPLEVAKKKKEKQKKKTPALKAPYQQDYLRLLKTISYECKIFIFF